MSERISYDELNRLNQRLTERLSALRLDNTRLRLLNGELADENAALIEIVDAYRILMVMQDAARAASSSLVQFGN